MSHRKTPFLFGLFFLFWGGAVVAQEAPGLAAPVGLEAISDASEYDDLVWIDRSSTLLNTGVSAIAIPSDQPDTVYVGGRGFVAKSIDGGITWTSTLSLAGASFQTTDDGRVEVHSDIEVFDDSDALDTYEETREELYDELEALYGEDYADPAHPRHGRRPKRGGLRRHGRPSQRLSRPLLISRAPPRATERWLLHRRVGASGHRPHGNLGAGGSRRPAGLSLPRDR